MSTQPSHIPPIGSTGEAEQIIANLGRIMDALLATLAEETELVRAGHLNEATALETKKSELASRYLADTERLKSSKTFVSQSLPETLAALRRRHDEFHALLQINLTVLATAHAVSEGIVRGVVDELNRKQVPQTYGASGRANLPGPKRSQPLAISRTL